MATSITAQTPKPRTGVLAKRVAGGRNGARRWELHENGEWIGELVHWMPENEWEFQPADLFTGGQCINDRELAVVLLKAGLV